MSKGVKLKLKNRRKGSAYQILEHVHSNCIRNPFQDQ